MYTPLIMALIRVIGHETLVRAAAHIRIVVFAGASLVAERLAVAHAHFCVATL
jgi:hypothetical protein